MDYLCQKISGEARAGGDAVDIAYAGEEELSKYQLTEAATRVLRKAVAMDRARRLTADKQG